MRRLVAKKEGTKKVILFNLSGHGHFDMTAYDSYFAGKLENHELHTDEVKAALAPDQVVPCAGDVSTRNIAGPRPRIE